MKPFHFSRFINNCGNDSPSFLLPEWSIITYSVLVGLTLSLLILVHSAMFNNSACEVSMSSAWVFEGIVISALSAYLLALKGSRQS